LRFIAEERDGMTLQQMSRLVPRVAFEERLSGVEISTAAAGA
jgi:hypothetical protein